MPKVIITINVDPEAYLFKVGDVLTAIHQEEITCFDDGTVHCGNVEVG